jgi:Tfp pilus assembly protein FimT
MRIADFSAPIRRLGARCRSSQAGVTILELTLILVIIGILTGLAVSRGVNTDQEILSGELETLKARLRYAQSLAFSQTNLPAGGAPVFWGVVAGGSQYTLTLSTAGATSTPLSFPGLGSPTASLGGGATISGTTIYFDFRGAPVSSTGTVQAANTTFTVTKDSISSTAVVTQQTGFIQ